jgi:hypothetical protein
MIYYFTNGGEPATPFALSGDQMVEQGNGIKAEVPEGIESWRLSLDLDTNTVVVAYEGMTEEDAHAQKLIDDLAVQASLEEVRKEAAEAERLAASA